MRFRSSRRRPRGFLRRNATTSIVLLALAAGAGYAKLTEDISISRTGEAETIAGVVHRVVDGDTLRLKGLETRIRIWGLDAPEVGTPGGSEATAALTSLALGEPLSCRQKDIDRHGRIVGSAFCPVEKTFLQR
ncbi:thermonuclease family protein [Amaricoccus macauensis]|uniref:thermonuclease family protein n=1 Tax=Amaricoccus macauensis TaxID=57001 RepID=UPI003C7CE2B1